MSDLEQNALRANLNLTLRDWVERYQREVVFENVQYRGVLTWKNVLDLWVYQEIIWETGVDCVVEIGVRHGGTTLWLADTLRNFRGDASLIVAIDIEPPATQLPPNVKFIHGSSVAPEVVQQVHELCAGRRTMVMADGNHEAEHVLRGAAVVHAAGRGRLLLHRRGRHRRRHGMEGIHARPARRRASFHARRTTTLSSIARARNSSSPTRPDGFLKRIKPRA